MFPNNSLFSPPHVKHGVFPPAFTVRTWLELQVVKLTTLWAPDDWVPLELLAVSIIHGEPPSQLLSMAQVPLLQHQFSCQLRFSVCVSSLSCVGAPCFSYGSKESNRFLSYSICHFFGRMEEQLPSVLDARLETGCPQERTF